MIPGSPVSVWRATAGFEYDEICKRLVSCKDLQTMDNHGYLFHKYHKSHIWIISQLQGSFKLRRCLRKSTHEFPGKGLNPIHKPNIFCLYFNTFSLCGAQRRFALLSLHRLASSQKHGIRSVSSEPNVITPHPTKAQEHFSSCIPDVHKMCDLPFSRLHILEF